MTQKWQMTALKIHETRPDDSYGQMDGPTAVEQIGVANVLAISGGRVANAEDGIYMPVSNGYWVSVHLHVDDTYIVRRVLYRQGQGKVKQEWRGVYADNLGVTAYHASCFNN
jgi:hypothetical protein